MANTIIEAPSKFIYPTRNQFPFDKVANQIVKEIAKRNWKIPKLEIKYDTYGSSGYDKQEYLNHIIGKDFVLNYSKHGLYSIGIPKQIIEVFEDESGPRYWLYVGKNYKKDQKWFFNSIKVHSKLENKPRRYLAYTGKHNYCSRPEYLINDTDLDREYKAEGNEPVEIKLSTKFKEFTDYLKGILDYIKSFPVVDHTETPLKKNKLIPYKGIWDVIYTPLSDAMVEKINYNKIHPKAIKKSARYAIAPDRRLVYLSNSCVNNNIYKIASDGFVWCEPNTIDNEDQFKYDIRNSIYTGLFGKASIAKVKLMYSNNVYVVDQAAYEETREEMWKTTDRLSDYQLNQAMAKRAMTLIPINDYKKGMYKDPIIVMNREVEFDEIEDIIPSKGKVC